MWSGFVRERNDVKIVSLRCHYAIQYLFFGDFSLLKAFNAFFVMYFGFEFHWVLFKHFILDTYTDGYFVRKNEMNHQGDIRNKTKGRSVGSQFFKNTRNIKSIIQNENELLKFL